MSHESDQLGPQLLLFLFSFLLLFGYFRQFFGSSVCSSLSQNPRRHANLWLWNPALRHFSSILTKPFFFTAFFRKKKIFLSFFMGCRWRHRVGNVTCCIYIFFSWVFNSPILKLNKWPIKKHLKRNLKREKYDFLVFFLGEVFLNTFFFNQIF